MANENPWVIQVREATSIPPFVVKSWLSSFRKSDWAGPIPNNEYERVYTGTINQLLARGATVLVACNPDNPNHILGWLCYEFTRDGRPVVHYVYVKSLWRQAVKRYGTAVGVATSLFAAAGIDPKARFFYTFRTNRAHHFPGGSYVREIACRKNA
jgi:hypothetical protein